MIALLKPLIEIITLWLRPTTDGQIVEIIITGSALLTQELARSQDLPRQFVPEKPRSANPITHCVTPQLVHTGTHRCWEACTGGRGIGLYNLIRGFTLCHNLRPSTQGEFGFQLIQSSPFVVSYTLQGGARNTTSVSASLKDLNTLVHG